MSRLILISLIIVMIFSLTQCGTPSPFSNDILLIFDSYQDFSNGYYENIDWINKNDGFLYLSSTSSGFSPMGKYTSKVIKTDFPVEEIYPSWNITCPKQNGGFKIYIRVSPDNINWSGWYYMGSWGVCPKVENEFIKDDSGRVEIDSLFLKEDISYIQYSISMFSDIYGQVSPGVKLFALTCGKRSKEKNKISEKNYYSACRLNVPYRSQGDEDRAISGKICSPTSVAMVMEYWGVNIPTAEIAWMCYDREHDIYGIWPVAVQVASQYGLKGWVRIFKNMEEVEEEIAAGRPVIATICFAEGKLGGSFTSASDGHVIVISGFDNFGNPVCNDPAGRDEREGVLIYNRQELEKAWLWESGIGYIILRGN